MPSDGQYAEDGQLAQLFREHLNGGFVHPPISHFPPTYETVLPIRIEEMLH